MIGAGSKLGVPPKEGETVDNKLTGDIVLIGNDVVVPAGTVIPRGAVVTQETLEHYINGGANA